jgi:hypothetical protein
MSRYRRDRLDSRPVTLTIDEASALATWVIRLTDSLADGVSLAISRPAALNQRHALDNWDDDRLADQPALFAKILAHLLTSAAAPIWDDIARVALAVRNGAEPADFDVIRNQALRLGVAGAESW